jgi:hypothetical protein
VRQRAPEGLVYFAYFVRIRSIQMWETRLTLPNNIILLTNQFRF